MEIQRTANAGVLLKLDGVAILLDGLCDRVEGYLPTPPDMAKQLLDNPPDVLAFTHCHKDHCSDALLLPYRKQNLRPIYGPESLRLGKVRVGEVTITVVPSRHLGNAEQGLEHVSYIIEGSQCVWFTGDAAPLQWKTRTDLPRPDVLIAPFAYGNAKSPWELVKSITEKMVLLHLPHRQMDEYGLWDAVERTTADRQNVSLWVPEIGERIVV